jgi:hypothetical protein
MTRSPINTANVKTDQASARTNGPLNMIILHHGATTSDAQIISMMVTNSREVSAHKVIKDKRITGVVDEELRAWSLADQYWDSRAFTVETANESTDGWTISAESHESLAQSAADWARRYHFPIIRSKAVSPEQWTLIGHREVYSIHDASYATACPGGMNLDWIAARANEILSGKPVSKGTIVTAIYQYNNKFDDKGKARTIEHGERLRLLQKNSNKQQNVVGGPGKAYSISPHFVASGFAPGDTVTGYLVWSNKGKESGHFKFGGVADQDGLLAMTGEFKKAVQSGDSVFFDVIANPKNTGVGTVESFATDTYLYS